MAYRVSHVDGIPFCIDGLPAKLGGSETAGFMTMARSRGEDLLFWTCIYIGHSLDNARWTVDEPRVIGTILLRAPSGETGKQMAQGSFSRTGIHIPEYLGPDDLRVSRNGDITWELAGRRLMWSPPGWRIEGTHGGVTASLDTSAIEEPLWTLGPLEDLDERGAAGYDVPTVSHGWIRVNDEAYPINSGFGSHERLINLEGRRNILQELMNPILEGDCFSEGMHVYFETGGRYTPRCRVVENGVLYAFSAAATNSFASVVPITWWHDVESGLKVPTRWRISAMSENARLEMETTAMTRGYWHYFWRTGVVSMMWILGHTEGRFWADGRPPVRIQSALTGTRWCRTILVRKEELLAEQGA